MFFVKSIELHRKNRWASLPTEMGPLEGKIELLNDKESLITMKLTAEQTKRIITVLSEALVDTAKEASKIMVSQVIEQTSGLATLAAPSNAADDIPF